MSTIEQREKWAGMFGFIVDKELSPIRAMIMYKDPLTGRHYTKDNFPDFSDLRGPYVGPAIKELIDAEWIVGCTDDVYDWWNEIPELQSRDADLGVATMNALLAKREAEAGREKA